MASDSKLIKWFGRVIKYMDQFSIEQDQNFFVPDNSEKITEEPPYLVNRFLDSVAQHQQISYPATSPDKTLVRNCITPEISTIRSESGESCEIRNRTASSIYS
ncbi:hypothetical protein CDAR_201221 [Caerostris darwini]|uniref:Uncharacterized protein n=1 Tax=Caerostris darwini TaxID=1538125 RepID=A0AAV4P2Q1_9ARAC|nr:hypothetical protein CDAR_201221 [Caerostris darwini]